jgi:hypothetical protein
MSKKRRASKEEQIPGLTCCKLCESDGEGTLYEFWTGMKGRRTEEHRILSNTKLVKTAYSDMQNFRVFLCHACVGGMRRKHYRLKMIPMAFFTVILLIFLGALLFANLTQANHILLIAFGVPTALTALGALYYTWEYFRPVPDNPITEKLVLDRIKVMKEYVKKGHDIFTQSQYLEQFRRQG